MYRIFGPPGTGKTTRLINEVSLALEKGISPHRVAFLSFTNKACDEARERAGRRFGFKNAEKDLFWFKTIHSFSKHCMDERGMRCLGDKEIKQFASQVRLVNLGNTNTEEADDKGFFRNSPILSLIHRARVKKIPLRTEYNISTRSNLHWHEVEYVSESYNNFKKNQSLYDFTDMLEMFLTDALATCPEFDLILLDEAQDLSPLQWDIARVLDKKAKKMYCAGDDDQAIYVWAGASPKDFIDLDSGAEVLSQSYRVPEEPYKIAQTIIKQVSKGNRFPKKYSPTPSKGEVHRMYDPPCEKIKEIKCLSLSRCAFMLREIAEELRINGLFFQDQYGNLSVSQSVLHAIRGWETLRKGERVDLNTAQKIYKFMSGNGIQIKRGKKTIHGQFDTETFTYEDLKEHHGLLVDKDVIWRDALDLIKDEQETYIVSLLKKKEKLGREPRIILSTIHGAKGAESDNVVVLTDISSASERETRYNKDALHRLFYVAVTRTKNSLYILYPKDPDKSYLIV